MEDILRPPIVRYTVTHNLTVSGATVFITVTSPVADIPLNGVPPGHYYVSVTVAAVNVVGQGQRSQESFTGYLIIIVLLLSSLTTIYSIYY